MLRELVAEHGFAIIPAVFSREEIVPLRVELSQTNLGRGRAGMRNALQNPFFAAFARAPRLLSVANDVLGAEAFPFRARCSTSLRIPIGALRGIKTEALPLRERLEIEGWGPWSVKHGITYALAPSEAMSKVIALRVHLDDSIASNGPLRVCPEPTSWACWTMNRWMEPLIVHSSSKSQTDKPRRVLHIEYTASACIANGPELAIA
jgi:hypothetical protein